MLIRKYFVCIIFVLQLTACSSYSLKSGPALKNLNSIPAPRLGGPIVNFKTRYNRGDFEIMKSTLLNSGYFTDVTYSKKSTSSDNLFVDVEHYFYKKPTGYMTAATTFLATFSLGVFPAIDNWDETWSVKVKSSKGKIIKKYKYQYKGSVKTTIWPWAFLFGAAEDRSERQRYARFASNLIYDLNKDGYLSE